jgi:hypothetical protein
MSTMSYRITMNAGSQMDLAAGINAQVLPLLNQAVKAVAKQTAADWQQAVYSARLWSGEKDAYAKSISWRMTGDFSAMVEADYQHAAEIETGRAPRDMKKMLDTSSKVRRTTDGRRFLVIPMRHNTPGNTAHAAAMPSAVHALAKDMAASSVTSSWRKRRAGEITHLSPHTGMQPAAKQSAYLSRVDNRQAVTVKRQTYAWGDHMTKAALKAAGADASTVKRYAGMVKMDTSTPGGAKSSSYMTFRIMMDGQTGKWIVPAQPGLYLARNVAQKMQPKAVAAFAAAVKKTVSG